MAAFLTLMTLAAKTFKCLKLFDFGFDKYRF